MAKDPKLDIAPDESLGVAEESTKPKSYRLHILVILIGVVLAEAALLFFLLPSPTDVQGQLANIPTQTLIEGEPYVVSPNVLPSENKKEEYVEKELGEKFRVQSIRPGTGQTIDSFTVTVIVNVFKKDETAYNTLFEKNKFAVREAVENVLFASTLEDRTQVALGTIKQKIMKAINDVLGEPYVRSVICNDPVIDMM